MTWRRLVRTGVYSTCIRDLLIGEQYILGQWVQAFRLSEDQHSLHRSCRLPFIHRPSRDFLVKDKPEASQKTLLYSGPRAGHNHCFCDAITASAVTTPASEMAVPLLPSYMAPSLIPLPSLGDPGTVKQPTSADDRRASQTNETQPRPQSSKTAPVKAQAHQLPKQRSDGLGTATAYATDAGVMVAWTIHPDKGCTAES